MSLPFRLVDLESAARGAADEALRAGSSSLDVEEKSDHSPVTAVDRAVNEYLRRELGALLPEAAWLSEESLDDRARLHARWVWIVDPIDGTDQLVRAIPELAISIGLAEAGRVVAAAVVNPMTGERGAWVEGFEPSFEGLVVRPPAASLAEATAIVSRTETEAGELASFWDLVGSTRELGSVAYKLLRVAAGADDLTFSLRPKHEWDICGGVGLVLSGGRAYLRLDANPVRFNRQDTQVPGGAVAGPPGLAAALRDRLKARLAPGSS